MRRLAIVLSLASCPKSAPVPPYPPVTPLDGPAWPDDTARVIEKLESVDFDGDGVDELVELELSQTESTATRYAAIYRVQDGARVQVGLWLLMDSNGTEGTGCNHGFSYSEPDEGGLRIVTIEGGEYSGMTSDEEGAAHGCDPEPRDFVLRGSEFTESP